MRRCSCITRREQARRVPAKIALVVILFLISAPTRNLAASSWSPTLLVNTESFQVVDEGDSTTDVEIRFGDTLNKKLTYNRSLGQFSFDDNLEVLGTISGTTLHASETISSSGTIVVDQNAVQGSGGLVVNQTANFSTGALIRSTAGTGYVLALDNNNQQLWGDRTYAPHILFGYRGMFDTNLYRSSGSTLRTDDVFLITSTDADNHVLLYLDTKETTAGQNLIFIESDVAAANDPVWRVQADGKTFADGAYSGAGADYAEWFFSRDAKTLRSGELVCIDSARASAVERCRNSADNNLVGIISAKPAFVGNAIGGAGALSNDAMSDIGYTLVGLIGQIPTWASDEAGPIKPGDALTSASTPGYARRAVLGEPSVGVALESLKKGEGQINVLISRRN